MEQEVLYCPFRAQREGLLSHPTRCVGLVYTVPSARCLLIYFLTTITNYLKKQPAGGKSPCPNKKKSMNRKNENKPAYSKPSIELITIDSEGSLLLTGSLPETNLGAKSPGAYTNGGTFSSRGAAKTSTTRFLNGGTFSSGNRN